MSDDMYKCKSCKFTTKYISELEKHIKLKKHYKYKITFCNSTNEVDFTPKPTQTKMFEKLLIEIDLSDDFDIADLKEAIYNFNDSSFEVIPNKIGLILKHLYDKFDETIKQKHRDSYRKAKYFFDENKKYFKVEVIQKYNNFESINDIFAYLFDVYQRVSVTKEE